MVKGSNNKETKRKYLRMRSDGEKPEAIKKPKENIFGCDRLVKGNQNRNFKKTFSDVFEK
jgi:hypothetical protein